MLKLVLLPLLVLCLAAEIPKNFERLHKPYVRRIGNVTYDLKPLVEWDYLGREHQKHFQRPYHLGNWFKVNTWSPVFTNCYTVARSGHDSFVAIRNYPTNHPPVIYGYLLPAAVTTYYGSTLVRATAYDFGVGAK